MPLINFSGIASGIDTNGLISAASAATRETEETPLQNTINSLTATDNDLGTLKTKFQTLQTLLQGWSTVSGGAVVKQVSSSDETLLSATASSSANDGSYTVTIPANGKALNGVQAITQPSGSWTDLNQTVSDGATLTGGAADNITVQVGTETEILTVSATTTIGDLITQYNSNATQGLMTAVNVGTTAAPNYELVVNSLNTGAAAGTVTISFGSDFTPTLPGPPGVDPLALSTAQTASDSTFDVAGVATGIKRPTNTITDVLPGVNLDIINAPTSPTQVTLTVGEDVSSTTSNVQDFVDDWNDIVTFIAQESTITQSQSTSTDSSGQQTTGTTNTFGPLSSSREASNSLSAIRDALAGAIAPGGSQVKIMADLGITTNEDGTLAFDTDTFAQALGKEPNSVNQLLTGLADTLSTPETGTIDEFVGFNQIFDTTVNANNSQISDLNDQISQVEENISQTETAQREYYANFEAQMGQLQSQQQTLTSALAGLSAG